jgi:hypothetical protein
MQPTPNIQIPLTGYGFMTLPTAKYTRTAVRVNIKVTLAKEPMISDLCHPKVY